MANHLMYQEKADFVKVVKDDRDVLEWEFFHFLREWACIVKRGDTRTPWAHWVSEGLGATAGRTIDVRRLEKAIKELDILTDNEGNQ